MVTCLEVLEHLPSYVYAAARSELSRVAKKWIVVTVPNREDLERSLVRCPSCRCRFSPSYHVRAFAPSGMHELFDGFSIVLVSEIVPIRRSVLRPALNWVAHRVDGRIPACSLCPQCRYRPAQPTGGASPRQLVTGRAPRILRGLSPKRVRAEWLLASYVREAEHDVADTRA